nr:uncharacterized protein LOC128705223 [Cherax quadricarinatus]
MKAFQELLKKYNKLTEIGRIYDDHIYNFFYLTLSKIYSNKIDNIILTKTMFETNYEKKILLNIINNILSGIISNKGNCGKSLKTIFSIISFDDEKNFDKNTISNELAKYLLEYSVQEEEDEKNKSENTSIKSKTNNPEDISFKDFFGAENNKLYEYQLKEYLSLGTLFNNISLPFTFRLKSLNNSIVGSVDNRQDGLKINFVKPILVKLAKKESAELFFLTLNDEESTSIIEHIKENVEFPADISIYENISVCNYKTMNMICVNENKENDKTTYSPTIELFSKTKLKDTLNYMFIIIESVNLEYDLNNNRYRVKAFPMRFNCFQSHSINSCILSFKIIDEIKNYIK